MPGPNWDGFAQQVRDAHTDVFDLPLVTVYNFTGGYDPTTGETDNWTRGDGTDVPCEVVVPDNPEMTTGPEGQEAEVKFRAYIRDDAPVTIHDVGTENHRPTEIEHQGDLYVVADVFDENNGQLRLLCVEA